MTVKSIAIRKIVNSAGETKFRVDYYHNGRRQRPRFDTEKEARDHKRDLMIKLSNLSRAGAADPMAPAGDIEIHSAIRKYDELCSAGKDSHSEDRRYFRKLYDFLLDEVGIFTVQEIQPIHIEQFQKKLSEIVSASTVNRHFNTYRNFFRKLVDWGFIAKSPSASLKNLPTSPAIRMMWTVDQAAALIDAVPGCYGDFLFFMAQTGARNVETRQLNWGDVNFGMRFVTVASKKGNRGRRARPIPMTQGLAIFLAEKFEAARSVGRSGATDPVFVNTRGNRIQNQALDEAVAAARKKLGFDDRLTPYGLRHFLTTALSAENQSEEKIRRLMGHAPGSKVTSDYTHLNVQHLREALETTEQAKMLRRNGHQWALKGI
jgi:site-specific recombinase XerD